MSKPIAFTVEGDRVILPMGSYPQWLTVRSIAALRLDLNCADCLRSFQLKDLTLLHYKPDAGVPNTLGEKLNEQTSTTPAVVKGSIDTPKEGDTVARDFQVGGWALADGGIVKDVAVSVDGKAPITAEPGVPRPDVAAAFPDIASTIDSGWNAMVPVEHLNAGKHQIAVTVKLRDGTEQVLGTVNVSVVK